MASKSAIRTARGLKTKEAVYSPEYSLDQTINHIHSTDGVDRELDQLFD